MATYDFDRRRLIQALGLGGVAGFLPSLRNAQAAEKPPRRIVLVYTEQGLLRPLWEPKGDTNNFELSPMLSPLESLKGKLTLLSGLDFRSYKLFGGGSNAHRGGQIHALTSAEKGTVEDRSGGISIDQFIAGEINKPRPVTLLPSMLLGIQSANHNGSKIKLDDSPCYSGPNNQVDFELDALAIYRRLFPGNRPPSGGGGGGAPNPADLSHRSVLDFLAQEFKTVSGDLPQRERQKLEAHGELIRDMEKRLALTLEGGGNVSTPTASCSAPAQTGLEGGARYEASSLADFKAKTEARLRLVQGALACDLTRVVVVMMAMPPIFDTANQHDLCHQTSDGTSGDGVQKVLAAQKAYFEMYAKLGQLLDAVPESDGQTLLDHTAVVWCGQIASGGHDKMNHKWAVLGKLGGHIRGGRYLKVQGTPHSNLWTSLANGMGINIDKFGAKEACTGPLTGLG